MNHELSYINEEGFTVFTSHYLKNKKTCCRSACLHCPYGFTVKKHGFEFREATAEETTWAGENPGQLQAKVLLLKGIVAGVFFHNHLQIKKLVLKEKFNHQEISKELIESYFF